MGDRYGTGGERVPYRFGTEHLNECGAVAERCFYSKGLLFHCLMYRINSVI